MDITDFIEGLSSAQKNIMQFLDHEINSLPGIELKSRYKLPFYYRYSWICYMNPIKSDKVELCFIRGYQLSNENGFLDARGRSMISGVIFSNVSEIDAFAVRETLHEALLIDKAVKEGKRKK